MYYEQDNIGTMIGKTMSSVTEDREEMIFTSEDGTRFIFYHSQDCCESVSIEDIVGDLQDLVGSPILMAEESSNRDDPVGDDRYAESYTWTYYKFATIKGSVDVRWFGSSNGYYSESVNFRVDKP